MPMYDYRFIDAEGGQFEDFQPMTSDALTERGGRPCERMIGCPAVITQYGAGNSCDPVQMLSIALDNEYDIRAFRERNPGVEISDQRADPRFGVPIAYSRGEKDRILAQEGFVDKNKYG